MTRETSIEAYHYIVESGKVAERHRQLYSIVYNHGPITANSAFNVLKQELGALRFDSNTRARFTELREMGLIQEMGTGTDPITKRRVIVWDVTKNFPRKPPKSETKSMVIAKLAKEVARLEIENKQLKERIAHLERVPELVLRG